MINEITKGFSCQLLPFVNAKNCELPKKSRQFLSFEKTSARFRTSHMRIFEDLDVPPTRALFAVPYPLGLRRLAQYFSAQTAFYPCGQTLLTAKLQYNM